MASILAQSKIEVWKLKLPSAHPDEIQKRASINLIIPFRFSPPKLIGAAGLRSDGVCTRGVYVYPKFGRIVLRWTIIMPLELEAQKSSLSLSLFLPFGGSVAPFESREESYNALAARACTHTDIHTIYRSFLYDFLSSPLRSLRPLCVSPSSISACFHKSSPRQLLESNGRFTRGEHFISC